MMPIGYDVVAKGIDRGVAGFGAHRVVDHLIK
jgi:hypothetical protein